MDAFTAFRALPKQSRLIFGRLRRGLSPATGYALLRREGPVCPPDVFLIQNMSAADSVMAGFANLGGEWGQLYCGAGENDHLDMKQCR
jgi:hypothetical protein